MQIQILYKKEISLQSACNTIIKRKRLYNQKQVQKILKHTSNFQKIFFVKWTYQLNYKQP